MEQPSNPQILPKMRQLANMRFVIPCSTDFQIFSLGLGSLVIWEFAICEIAMSDKVKGN